MAAAKKKKKFTLRFFLILLTPILLAGVYFVYRMKNPTHGKLSEDTVVGSMSLTAVIIRSETVTEATDYTSLRMFKGEAETVSPGEKVAVLYSKGYDTQLGEIVTRASEIYSKQSSILRAETGELPEEVTAFNEKITDTVDKMTRAAMYEEDDYLQLTDSLLESLETRENYLRSILPAADNIELESKYEAIDSLRRRFDTDFVRSLVHEGSEGYISFHLDGYETALNVSNLTSSQIRQIVSSPQSGAVNENAVYRSVDKDGFHLAFTVKSDSAFRFVVGQTYRFMVDYQDKVYTGEIISEKTSGSYVLYVARVETDAGEVLGNRTLAVTVSSEASGVSIPVEGLYFDNGVPYIYVYTSGATYEPLEVVILCADEEKAVIRAKNPSIQLRPKLKFEYHEAPENTTAS